ncbi:HAD hydrolase-like protein [Sphaerochaeta sp. PS]|uniref:HAD hydrolase-like protein n=1 Tax=Sphaerochaeta sp. PS TaxID=3076336 RepID=UPI0028A2E642|nr:HAD hydrolase-like protein [Sphaerochaeta sp. PS]MDT4762327.1 HAD hydrolase-like protein [Sphaerochaeta sp. PS]
MKFKLAIFDLDGTLMDTSAGIFATANKAVELVGRPPEHDIKQLSKFIGPPIVQCFINTYNLDEELIESAIGHYREEYVARGQFNAIEYPGIKETLAKLKEKGYLLGVGTLKTESLALTMMSHFGFEPYFSSIRGADMSSKLSKADIVNMVLKDLGIDPSEAVLIGDTIHDEEGAKEANVSFIAVDYGFGFPRGQQRTDSMLAVVSSPQELLSLL